MGLRNFSMATGMSPSEYSDIERGLAPPPKDEEWIHKIVSLLEMPQFSEDEMGLYVEWNKPFIMQLMDEDIYVCHALMADDTSADAEKLGGLSEYLQKIAVEHNKKAKEYNEKNVN